VRCRCSLAVSAVSSFVPDSVDHGHTNARSPHRSQRADFHAAGSSGATPRPVPRMGYPRKQQRMATEEFYIFSPRHSLPASSATEPLPPDIADCPIELPDAPGVRRSSVILVVAPEFGIEGLLLFLHRLVSVRPAPFGDRRQAPRNRFFIVRTFTVNFPLRLRAQMCVKPRKSNVAGFFSCLFACSSAYRPKSTSLVFSGWSVRPYLANRFGKTSITFSASSRYWKHSTASSAKRISCATPFKRGFTSCSNHLSST
jgi:hypothetical protein